MNDSARSSAKGKLFLIPAPLDFGCADEEQTPITDTIPSGTLKAASQIRHFICENAKSCRAILKRIAEHYPLACTLQEIAITELPREAHKRGDHTSASDTAAAKSLLNQALQGFDMGLMSEAGMPAIADPGSSVVRAAHAFGIEVVPLVGPISMMLALAASGLNGQNFAFNGYLPQDAALKKNRIQQLEKLALASGQTQLFIETPYRNAALLADLMSSLQPNTRLAFSVGVTLPSAKTISFLVKDWRADKSISERLLASKLPAIFSFGA
jgi:16S rRNA (cytidine1402-2'-O)-methyltransferase